MFGRNRMVCLVHKICYWHYGEAQGEPRKAECRYKVTGDHVPRLFKLRGR